MKIVGIDASLTNTGIVVIEDKGMLLQPVYFSTVITSQVAGVRRLIDLRNQVHSCLVDADLIVIEGYAYAAANQAHQVGEFGGVLRVMFHEEGFSWIEVAPSQLKQFACGNGNAPKELILQQVYKRWGVEMKTSHEADAYVLARLGAAYLGHVQGLTALQFSVVDEVRSGKVRKAKKVKKEKGGGVEGVSINGQSKFQHP